MHLERHRGPAPANAAVDPQGFLQSVSCSRRRIVCGGRSVSRLVGCHAGSRRAAVQRGLDAVGGHAPGRVALTTGSERLRPIDLGQLPVGGSCTAVGLYSPDAPVASRPSSTPCRREPGCAAAAPLPARRAGSQFLSLACPAAGSCVAAGTYQIGRDLPRLRRHLVGGDLDGHEPPPPDRAPPRWHRSPTTTWRCRVQRWARCVVAGTTFDGNYEGLIDTLSGGAWTATPVADPGRLALDRRSTDLGGLH